jgi:transcriptional regulator with XRE-family HTH domain
MATLQTEVGARVRRLRQERGWTQEELAARAGRHWTYIGGVERGERNITLTVLDDLARALEVDCAELVGSDRTHPLEREWNCAWQDVLSAIEHGFRAQADVKGKLAEHFLAMQLSVLERTGTIDGYTWYDEDGKPDFDVVLRGQRVPMECKNVRSGTTGRSSDSYKVEIQRTRNSKDGRNTRGYRADDFGILAACLFNQTGRWEHVFIATRHLQRRPSDVTFLKVMQRVPSVLEPPWHDQLVDALEEALL